tara:strand:- start:905 stop:1273 length:369 start_codon:yes stop_codon:yes gene_type:complete
MLKTLLTFLIMLTAPHIYAQSNCDLPTTDIGFKVIINDVSDEISEDDKLSKSKDLVSEACLTTNQIKQLLEVITYESYKVEFAKFAYQYCFDPINYDSIYDEFSFSSSTEELKVFIQSQNKE